MESPFQTQTMPPEAQLRCEGIAAQCQVKSSCWGRGRSRGGLRRRWSNFRGTTAGSWPVPSEPARSDYRSTPVLGQRSRRATPKARVFDRPTPWPQTTWTSPLFRKRNVASRESPAHGDDLITTQSIQNTLGVLQNTCIDREVKQVQRNLFYLAHLEIVDQVSNHPINAATNHDVFLVNSRTNTTMSLSSSPFFLSSILSSILSFILLPKSLARCIRKRQREVT